MSYLETKYSGRFTAGNYFYLCDTRDDVSSLPEAPMGSAASVIEDGSVWIINSSGEWIEQPSNGIAFYYLG